MIFQRRYRGVTLCHVICQIGVAELLFLCWQTWSPIRLTLEISESGITNYARYAIIAGCALALDGARIFARNSPILELSIGENLRRSGRQCITVLVGLLLFLVLNKDTTISRGFLFSFIAALYALLFASNRWLPAIIARTAFPHRRHQRTVIFGPAGQSRMFQAWVDARRAFGLKVVGFIEPQDHASLPQRLKLYGAQQLIVLGIPNSVSRLRSYCQACERLGVRLLILSDRDTGLGSSVVINEQDGLQCISFQKDILECPYNRLLKRAFDLAVAIPVCLFFLPLLSLAVWLLQRSQAPGPLFFRQKRTGIHGREFWMIKFRTMRVNNEDESRQATTNDPRIFPAGSWLRRTSLDEIPQFLNVLFGEMSVVGPRPHLKAHDEQFAETAKAYRSRQFVKPGITGLAQVTGWRGETKSPLDVVKRVEADIAYLERWSLGLDFVIVARTAIQVLAPLKTAY